jgi:ipoprotein LpqH
VKKLPTPVIQPDFLRVSRMAPGLRRYIRLVKNTVRVGGVVLAVGLALGSAAGCSSPPPQQQQPGTLVSGTAEVTIGSQSLGKVKSVDCTPAGDTMTITTGDENSGTTTLVSNGDRQSVTAVTIRDLGGFTGTYTESLAGDASVSMTGATYAITGTADGFQTDNPSFRSNSTFTIKVAC